MNKTMKYAIAAAAVVVAALVALGAFLLIGKAPEPGPDVGAAEVSSQTDKGAASKPAARPGVMDVHRRHPRIMDRNSRNVATKSLPVPMPTTRDGFTGDKADERRQERPASAQPGKANGPVPVEVTVDNSRRLAAEGRTDDARRLLRNAILTEPQPLNRHRLQQELSSLSNPDGTKAQPTAPGQVK